MGGGAGAEIGDREGETRRKELEESSKSTKEEESGKEELELCSIVKNNSHIHPPFSIFRHGRRK